MTTIPTLQGVELRDQGQPDGLEARVLNQLRALRETWGERERPFVITICVYKEEVLLFDGNPQGRVRE